LVHTQSWNNKYNLQCEYFYAQCLISWTSKSYIKLEDILLRWRHLLLFFSNSDRLPPQWEYMFCCSMDGLNQMWILKHSKDMLDWKYFCCVWWSRIPMGTNCALLLADLFLYSYEADLKQGLLQKNANKQADPLISRSAV